MTAADIDLVPGLIIGLMLTGFWLAGYAVGFRAALNEERNKLHAKYQGLTKVDSRPVGLDIWPSVPPAYPEQGAKGSGSSKQGRTRAGQGNK